MAVHVLHVEDEPDIREVTSFALDDGAFKLTQCGSGAEALEIAQTLQPDLILLDVMMPGMDGPSTLQHLRKITHLANVPVIFMTAKVQAAEVKELIALGAAGVIAKPFDPMRLGEQILAIYNRRSAC